MMNKFGPGSVLRTLQAEFGAPRWSVEGEFLDRNTTLMVQGDTTTPDIGGFLDAIRDTFVAAIIKARLRAEADLSGAEVVTYRGHEIRRSILDGQEVSLDAAFGSIDRAENDPESVRVAVEERWQIHAELGLRRYPLEKPSVK